MIFSTRVAGIPCKVDVIHFCPGSSPTMEYPGDPEEFEFELLDRRNRPAPWLARKLTDQDVARISEEHHIMRQAEIYMEQPE